MGIENLYALYLASGQRITTDTRTISKGQIFFALKGENFNGNGFALEAIKRGARYAIVDDPKLKDEKNIIFVEDVLSTLQQLGLHHRRTLKIPIIAITGSNGKTTTKELIKEVLSVKFKVAFTKGNLNNHIGIPLTLLDIKAYDELSIVEMGANHVGEIEEYCTYVEPNYGLITNIGKAHLEGFGGIQGVIKGKTELYKYLAKTNGYLFVNLNDSLLVQESEKIKRIFYSIDIDSAYTGEILDTIDSEFLTIQVKDETISLNIQTNLTGDYNASNVMAAYCIGRYFDISPTDIKSAIEKYIPTNSRSQIIQLKNATIIKDAYNANPSSMEVALQNLAKNTRPKVAILGAMKELGTSSELEHQKIAELALELNIETVVLIGTEFSKIPLTSQIQYFATTKEAKDWFQNQVWNDEIILLKGSRGMALEQILEDS